MKTILSLALLALLFFASAAFANDCCWIDVKTGKQVRTVPAAGINESGNPDAGVAVLDVDRKHAHNPRSGQNFVRVPCPEPAAVAPAPPEKPKEQPNPLGKILQGVSVGVGVSGGQTVGRDDHKGDHHVTDHKRTSSTTKKLPAGCKCHPCTCAPCTCH